MEKVIIGIDLGGTNLRIGGVTPGNEMLAPSVISSTLIANADQPVQALCGVIQDYIKANRFPMVEAVSIGVPSSVARDKETVICTTNIRNRQGRPVFEHTNIALELRNRLGVPVFVNNDVNNILLYDVAANHLEGQQMVVGIYIGTGVGAAVLAGGRLLEGKDGAELDLGHIPFFRGEALCSCGKRGCCECYASGWRLQEIRLLSGYGDPGPVYLPQRRASTPAVRGGLRIYLCHHDHNFQPGLSDCGRRGDGDEGFSPIRF